MIVFTIFGIIFFVIMFNYFEKIKTKRKELINLKNKIEDEDLKKSWVNFLEKEYSNHYWNTKLKH